jgi:hypothetical protein
MDVFLEFGKNQLNEQCPFMETKSIPHKLCFGAPPTAAALQ